MNEIAMRNGRYWLAPLCIMLLTACGKASMPTATLPGTPATAPPLALASPTLASDTAPLATETTTLPIAPTRTVAANSSGDTVYADPQGRFSIILPKEWQPRAPTNPAASVLISFDAPDALASVTITVDAISLGTTAKEFAANTEKTIAGKVANYKKQGQESLTVGNIPAEALTYQGTVGSKEYLFRQILLAQGSDGWSITFPLDLTARQRYGPVVDTITQSFAFGTPIGKILVPTTGASTKPAGGSAITGTPPSTVKLPASALDWKANTPLAAGVPVRLQDAGIIAQLNGASFTTKAAGNAVLGVDEQFMIVDMTVWNIGVRDVVPAPDQCSITQERGGATTPETADVAADVAGGKVPPFGKTAIVPGTGVRGSVVVRVPKQSGLLIINYQPGTTRVPQPVQFYVKP
jgi:hypothetical protein